ncbi:hypothetical protein C2W62_23045 [Candidatus Entotheonella serta]|nr:hypothetical protein C2W62_23045 [Candidatus Entotheonella serta]
MRKQYHFRPSKQGYYAWDVDRLIALKTTFERHRVKLDDIQEIDENFWFSDLGPPPTCRAVAEHVRYIQEADLHFPIILSADGRVMDGMHRVVKALLAGHDTIEAVRFGQTPDPDYEDVYPDDLSYC